MSSGVLNTARTNTEETAGAQIVGLKADIAGSLLPSAATAITPAQGPSPPFTKDRNPAEPPMLPRAIQHLAAVKKAAEAEAALERIKARQRIAAKTRRIVPEDRVDRNDELLARDALAPIQRGVMFLPDGDGDGGGGEDAVVGDVGWWGF